MSLKTAIVCDLCRAERAYVKMNKGHAIRRELQGEGWIVALPGGNDYCPSCYTKLKTARLSLRGKV